MQRLTINLLAALLMFIIGVSIPALWGAETADHRWLRGVDTELSGLIG